MKNGSNFVSLGNSIIAKGRVLYFRLSVPRRHREHIGLTEFKISLRTPYIEEARASARLLSGRAQLVFEMLDRGACNNMNKEVVRGLVAKYVREVLEYDEDWRIGRQEPMCDEELQNWVSTTSGFGQSDKDDLAHCKYNTVEPLADEMIQEAVQTGVDMDDFKRGTASYRHLCRELLKARSQVFEISSKRHRGEYDDFESLASPPVPLVAESIAVKAEAVPNPQDEKEKKQFPKLSEAAEIYIKENSTAARGKANWTSEKTTLQHRTTIGRMLFVIGDIPVGDITVEHIEKYRDYMFKMPSNVQSKPQYRNKTYKQLMAMNIPEEDKAKDQTIKNNFIRANTFIRWLCTKYQLTLYYRGILTINLQTSPDEERLPFSAEDLQKIFNSELYLKQGFGKASHFWVPLMGLFTGARLEELCQLYLKDFEQTEAGVWYISITPDEDKKLKNKNAKRKVPIHDELIRLGLIQRVEHLRAHGFDRLFPELQKTGKLSRYGNTFSQWFTRFRRDLGIGAGSEEGKKTFHSFRHTMAEYFKQKGFEGTPEWATLKNVIGHSSGGGETVNRYSQKINPDVGYERVMRNLDYGLDLSHLMNSKYIEMVLTGSQLRKTGKK